MHGLQAKALQAEAEKLCTEFDKVYPSGAAQKSTAASAATLGAGAGTSAPASMPPLPRPTLLTDHSSGNARTEKGAPPKAARQSLEADAELSVHLP